MKSLSQLLVCLGINGTYKGYQIVLDSLQLASEKENNLVLFTKTIFPKVAKIHNTSIACVDRNIRTIIQVCWNSKNRSILLDMSPYPLYKPPSVGEFLAILLWAYNADNL